MTAGTVGRPAAAAAHPAALERSTVIPEQCFVAVSVCVAETGCLRSVIQVTVAVEMCQT